MIIDNNPRFDLAPYHEDDGRVFGGRDKTIKDLMNFIVRNHFVVLNGQSGIGKTSLIMAGIIPKVKELGWIPVYVRLMADNECSHFSIQLINSIEETIHYNHGHLKRDYPLHNHDTNSLVNYFKGLRFYNSNGEATPVLVIVDQFEELITKSRTSNKHAHYLHEFLSELGIIMDSRDVKDASIIEPQKKIFISYKRDNLEPVKKLKERIEQATGINCWMDLEGIESDAQFTNVIIKAINDADVFLFMYSDLHTRINDFENDWTIREISFAQKKKKRIVFINIDKTPLTDHFDFLFGTKQQVDALSDSSLNRLFHDIKKWLKPTIEGTDCHSGAEEKTFSAEINVLFSIRDNYLSKFEQEVKDIPSLQNNHFYLKGLNEEEAGLVIKSCSFVKDNDIILLIIERVIGSYYLDLGYNTEVEIDPTTLSLFLSIVRQQCIENGQQYATKELINSFDPTNALYKYYDYSTRPISKKTLSLLESELVGTMANRVRVPLSKLLNIGAEKREIEYLNMLNIIRFDNWNGVIYVELVSDLLCRPIMDKRNYDDTPIGRLKHLFK